MFNGWRVPSAVLLASAVWSLAGTFAPAGEDGVVLDARSYWRSHVTLRMPVVGTSAADAKPAAPETFMGKANGWRFDSQPPPADWMSSEFDDGSWSRAPGMVDGGYGFKQPMTHALVCVRGRFLVNDPAAAGLTLSLAYRGGVVVYLNGKEVARRNLPEGALTVESLAEIYPPDTYTTADGKAIDYHVAEKSKDRCGLRIRKLDGLALAPELLRKGANVLALEIHRAPVNESFVGVPDRWKAHWSHVGLVSVQLKAAKPEAVVPNVDRPKGFQVWNATPMTAVFDLDYGDPAEPLRPILLCGARNGTYSGQVVVSSDQAIKGLKAEMSELKLKGGDGKIPASAAQIRYALPGGGENGAAERYGTGEVSRFDDLAESPPAEVPVRTKKKSGSFAPGAVQPVWVTLTVPADAAAGEYEGQLTVRAEGQKDVAVPVVVKVAPWKLPDSKDYSTFVDMIQSPESVALRYEVPLWSDKHFALMDQTFKYLGQIGNQTVFIPMICHTHFGNSESMVRYVKQPDGSYKGDFTVMERYLDMAEKHLGKPRVLCLYLWDHLAGAGYFGKAFGRCKPRKVPVSVLDPETKQVTLFESPMYVEPEEAKAFWKPILAELMERLKKRGLDKVAMIGMFSDERPPKETVDLWAGLLPGVPWVAESHALTKSIHGVPVGYCTTVWQAAGATDPDVKRTYGWQGRGSGGQTVVEFRRDLVFACLLTEHRLLAEYNIQGQQCGFGRNGADFWPALKDKDGKWTGKLPNRYPESNWAQLSIKTCLLSPGPEGAVSTVRFEMIREGVEECEARIFIEKALLDDKEHKKILVAGEAPADTAARFQALLDERTRAVNWGRNDEDWFLSSGWQERSAKLYAAAGEVAKALGGGR